MRNILFVWMGLIHVDGSHPLVVEIHVVVILDFTVLGDSILLSH
jgi:hypothetical protein